VDGAKAYVRRAILAAYAVGQGNGPMNHLYGMDEPT
jgi:hydroxymethylpyrimidine/phosphomethylpyrimidine kinase